MLEETDQWWWAHLASTLRNRINCTRLFKFWAYSSTSYHYHSILTTPLMLQLPIQDKELPKHVQLALCNYNKNSLKESLCSQVGAPWHGLSFLEASDFNCSIFPQVLPVSLRWKQLSLMTKASQGWSPELLWQSVAFKLSYSKVLGAITALSFLGLFSNTINQNS